MANATGYYVDDNKIWKICYFHKDEIGMVVRIASNAHYTNFMAGLIFNIFLTITCVCLNSVTILAYMRSAFLKSKKSYFLIMLLSVNDLLVGLFGNGSFVSVLFTIIIGYRNCKIYIILYYAGFCTNAMSIMTLFGLNIERYLAILHPFYHRTEVTKSKLLKMIISFWLFILALRLTCLAFGDVVNLIISALYAFNALCTLYIYVAIYITARKRPPRAEAQKTERQTTEERVTKKRTNQIYELQNIKMVKSCAIVVGLVFICNTPYTLTYTVARNNTSSISVVWNITALLSVSSLNSLVFFWNNAILRKEAKRLFKH